LKTRRLAIIAIIALITGCGDNSSPTEQVDENSAESSSTPQPHVLQDQMDQIDKARALQEQLNTAAQDRLKQIDENTRRETDDG